MQLKQLRTSKKMLQKDVASLLGIDRTTYAKYESGASEPNHETLLKLAEIFGVSTDYILGRDEKKPTVQDDGLTEGERALMKQFRQLTPEQQDMVLRMVQAAADNQQ